MRQGRAKTVVRSAAALAGLATVAALALYAARAARRLPRRSYDYSHRTGFSQPAAQMRGAARHLARKREAASV